MSQTDELGEYMQNMGAADEEAAWRQWVERWAWAREEEECRVCGSQLGRIAVKKKWREIKEMRNEIERKKENTIKQFRR